MLQKGPLELTYRIYEYTASKRVKLDGDDDDGVKKAETQTNNSNDWKEVQLRISENGEMSVMGIQEAESELKPKREPPALKLIGKSTTINTSTATTATSCSTTGTACVSVLTDTPKVKTTVAEQVTVTTTTTTTTTVDSVKTSVASVSTSVSTITTSSTTVTADSSAAAATTTVPTTTTTTVTTPNQGIKHKIETTTESEPPPKQTKPTNHTVSLQHLSNNHPLKKHSQMARSLETSTFTKPPVTYVNKNLSNTQNRPGTPITTIQKYPPRQPPPCYMPKTTYTPIINVPKVQTTCAKPSSSSGAITTPTTAVSTKMTIKSKPSTPIGYKTLRDPPKSWNPQISRAKPSSDPKYSDLKNVRPAKFFKMRNNMPRYLGNPASGVKPMYQVHTSPEAKTDKSEIKKHSIVKIDPKTLKPISEKAPETTSLSNQSDLKINTSSVPIFNPLKLQSSSPKNDRKSPHSPKLTTKTSTSPPNKREKLNLSFTPPNPFIPNLTSPTVSPNQFLYPSGPPGFPSYDPRFMAAYHSLLYGQRMPFAPNHLQSLTLDLNQRMGPSTSPKIPQQVPPKVQSTTSPKIPQQVSPKVPQQVSPKLPPKNAKPVVKKSGKDTQKAEKSLQNAVEKLTQKKVESMASEVKNNNVSAAAAAAATEEVKSDIIKETKDKSEKNVDTGTKLEQEKNLSNNNTDSLASLVQVDGKK